MAKERSINQALEILENIAQKDKLEMCDVFILFTIELDGLNQDIELRKKIREIKYKELAKWEEIFENDYNNFKNNIAQEFFENKKTIENELNYLISSHSIDSLNLKGNAVYLTLLRMTEKKLPLERDMDILCEELSNEEYNIAADILGNMIKNKKEIEAANEILIKERISKKYPILLDVLSKFYNKEITALEAKKILSNETIENSEFREVILHIEQFIDFNKNIERDLRGRFGKLSIQNYFDTEFQEFNDTFIKILGRTARKFKDTERLIKKYSDEELQKVTNKLTQLLKAASIDKHFILFTKDFSQNEYEILSELFADLLKMKKSINNIKMTLTPMRSQIKYHKIADKLMKIAMNKINVPEETRKLVEVCNHMDYQKITKTLRQINTDKNSVGKVSFLYDYLMKIQYFATGNFNHEAIILFLFSDLEELYNNDKPSALKMVIHKKQNLFLDIYEELKQNNKYFHALLNFPQKISFNPMNQKDYHPIFIYFRLKKLIDLYKYHCEINNNNEFILQHLNTFTYVLENSQLFLPFYVKETSVIRRIQDEFSVTQEALGRYLGVSKQRVGQYKKGTIYKNGQAIRRNRIPMDKMHKLQAIIDFYHSFVYEETTIPYYGKQHEDSTEYSVNKVYQRYYASFVIRKMNKFIFEKNRTKFIKSSPKYNFMADWEDKLSIKFTKLAEFFRSAVVEIDEIKIALGESKKKGSRALQNYEIAKAEELPERGIQSAKKLYEENLKNTEKLEKELMEKQRVIMEKIDFMCNEA